MLKMIKLANNVIGNDTIAFMKVSGPTTTCGVNKCHLYLPTPSLCIILLPLCLNTPLHVYIYYELVSIYRWAVSAKACVYYIIIVHLLWVEVYWCLVERHIIICVYIG